MNQLVNSTIDKQFLITHDKSFNIVIENPREYYKSIRSLKEQIDNRADTPWVLSMGDKIVDLAKYSVLFTDYFDLSTFDKKLTNILFKKIVNSFQSMNIYDEMNKLNTQMCILLEKIKNNFEIPIEYDDEIDTMSLLKMINVHFQQQSTNFVEMLVSWINILVELLGIEIVWTVDIKSFLSREDYVLFQKEMIYQKITIINIESQSKYDFIDNEEVIIIDNDLCEIHR